jgi:circadian clock protein KaiB
MNHDAMLRRISTVLMEGVVLQIPQFFKGIALFTPGGDLVYNIDANKQGQWHLHLCLALQELLQLPEPPHFLVPCYTATVDRWLDPATQEVRTAAEAYPPVIRYQALLNAVFELGESRWSMAAWQEEWCNPLILASYRQQFPQLWHSHHLVMPVTEQGKSLPSVALIEKTRQRSTNTESSPPASGYVLRLFVAGINPATERTLQRLHQFLERSLNDPYVLEVVDIHRHPDKAEMDQVTATPTLVKVWPKPSRKLVGELDHVEKVLQILSGSSIGS